VEHSEVIAKLRAHEEGAMEALLLHHGPLMRYVISPILPDPRDREECLSEAAMRVWDSIDKFDPQRGSWAAWLTALTRNTALNHARSLRSHNGDQPLSDDLPDPQPTPEEELLRQEQAAALRKVLDRLSPKEKALLYRKYYYHQSTLQMAAELGLTVRAVEGRLYRLKRYLRKELGGDRHE